MKKKKHRKKQQRKRTINSFHYKQKKTSDKNTGSEIRNGFLPPDTYSRVMESLPSKNSKTFINYVDKRMRTITDTEGSHAALGFSIASALVLQYENIYLGIKKLLITTGYEEQIEAYLKSMKFYVLSDDPTKSMFCITDIKTLMFYLLGVMPDKTDKGKPCPTLGDDFNIRFNKEVLKFDLYCEESSGQERILMASLLRPVDTVEDYHHATMDDFLNDDRQDQDMHRLSNYFDEIFEYAMVNELYTSVNDLDEV